MTSADRRYHHGDLRATLLAAAADELRVVAPAQLSLRELARRVGVSHAAPAHHFGDKRGLFTALAAEGFQMLHRRTRQALDDDGALLSAGLYYVEFAIEHPSHFAVMFDVALLDTADAEYQRERATSFEMLYEAIRRGTGVDDAEELGRQTLAAWLLVHGIATLWLSGNLPYDRDPRLVGDVFTDLTPGLLRIVEVGAEQLAPQQRGVVGRISDGQSERSNLEQRQPREPEGRATP